MNWINKNKKTILFTQIRVLALIGKFLIWDNKNNRWLIEDLYYKPSFDEKITTASPFEKINYNNSTFVEVTDATKINSVLVPDFRQPKSKEELFKIINYAKDNKKKISMSGSRHSSNGQNLGNSIHVDMTNYDQIGQVNKQNNTVTIQSGAIWKQIQNSMSKEGYALKVMQDSNIFTLGGSMGTNIHGKDVRYGSFIQSVESFKIITADGKEIECSRELNYDLFKNAIGGFGMFGIITDVVMRVEKNTVYDFVVTNNNAGDLISKFDEFQNIKNSDMIEGHFSIAKNNLMKEVQIYYFTPNKGTKIPDEDLTGENSIWIRKAVYRLSRESQWGKDFRWWMQKNVSVSVDPQLSTRNNAMAAPFRNLQIEDPNSTDILQEYYVPQSRVQTFLEEYRKLVIDNNINLINCGVRKVNQDTEATVSYANEIMYGFVCYYKIDRDMNNNVQFLSFSKKLINYLYSIDAKYYLAYDIYDNNETILKMYPKLQELFAAKQKVDPQNLFDNMFYNKFK